MEAPLKNLLSEIQEWGRAHDERETEHARKMLNLKEETAQLVSMLIRAGRRQRLLEIGTSNGYSTIWLAWATSAFGGRVLSIDYSADKLRMADENLRRAGMRDLVDLHHGDATDVVRTLSGPFDFVLFDSVQVQPYRQLELLLPKLTEDIFVVADNAGSHPREMLPYTSMIAAQPGFDHMVVPIGKGLSIAHRNPQRHAMRPAA